MPLFPADVATTPKPIFRMYDILVVPDAPPPDADADDEDEEEDDDDDDDEDVGVSSRRPRYRPMYWMVSVPGAVDIGGEGAADPLVAAAAGAGTRMGGGDDIVPGLVCLYYYYRPALSTLRYNIIISRVSHAVVRRPPHRGEIFKIKTLISLRFLVRWESKVIILMLLHTSLSKNPEDLLHTT
jgi:hypothetical protein